MIQFYSPDIEETLTLSEGESAHCCRVLRHKEGDEIYVTDGKGHRFFCEIVKSHPSHTEVVIKRKETFPPERNYNLTLAVAPTKNSDRMEWMVEKAVEIGVDKIVLLRCKRSERKIQRSERLLKVMVSAMKQSLSTYMPELTEMIDFKDFVKESGKTSQKFFGYCSESFPRKELVRECKAGGEVVIMIGPEGDFIPEEVELAVKNDFVPVTFGNKRLRTETAGVFAVSAVNVINQLA
ncbi:MAG: 16S rRNA (uracil(1498)-N(3))-methyltransferase [Muribaculaceae bacterium]|nr:16S rRNA (uracil(1498)-N(3))-methyltransferase [Muribaculaceae bacterium]